jgi:hypothetical protein
MLPSLLLKSTLPVRGLLRFAIVDGHKTPLHRELRDTDRPNPPGCHGLGKYESTWNDEVLPHHPRKLSLLVNNWNDISRPNGKFQLRHDLIHGSVGVCGVAFARSHVEAFLSAASDIDTFCAARGKDIYEKLPTSTRTKEP